MDFLRQLGETISSGLDRAKGVVAGEPAVAPVTVTDGYPVGARRRRGKKTKKTKGGKSRRKTARRV